MSGNSMASALSWKISRPNRKSLACARIICLQSPILIKPNTLSTEPSAGSLLRPCQLLHDCGARNNVARRMKQKYLNSIGVWLRRHKLLRALLLLSAMTLLFLVEERVRGCISLGRYIRRLKAHGEKMTPRDFLLPRPAGQNENGAPEVLAGAKGLSPGTVLSNSYPPRMKLTQS